MSKKITIIVGSNRPMRFGDVIAQWVATHGEKQNTNVRFEIVDLKEIDLPFHDELKAPSSGEYDNPHTKAWAKEIDGSDGFIFVSPEYNGGYSAVLKNALDSIYAEWSQKPVAIVGYGAGPGLKGAAQLKAVLEHMKMLPVATQVNVMSPWDAFDEDGIVKADSVIGDIDVLLTDLISAVEAA